MSKPEKYSSYSEEQNPPFAPIALAYFIQTRGWERSAIESITMETVRKALEFINNAIAGRKVVEEAKKIKQYPGNSESIKAYDRAVEAHRLMRTDHSLEQILNLTKDFLESLQSKNVSIKESDQNLIALFFFLI
ncbi:MAG: hypothetical protein A2383_00975 [Candidatus Pacebacteria bacterium RIFOXYB1_FULL_39_46]|nr:MAG: hypothetical protein A2182_00810 [Candidatus Pacebacteria bacterium RIFOXYA1_FULL_38_18]OGJ38154.1 MAG: hypothetical protein A2383_00975 [Candidatus Pacebacteria bacterium RIFOXYB1_FULL_39_46]OGJ39624.1 MAG: hypothetical protein A2411_02465 [Candidatus Pacebacteria bacterium RIFOXYC1_FULL_39_21]OGJ39906.1 MAG: hypothetical protein A2582_00740 [Candidatus Pacebacteria bacterium RIFOXYD1_FULL_39_27]